MSLSLFFFLVQNVPQIVLQIWYLWKIGGLNTIAISSMVFSFISIMVTTISIMTTKEILDSQGYAVVKFDVTGSVSQRCDECRNKTKKIGILLSNSLGLDKGLLEVQRPRKIPNGLQMILEIHLNHIKSRNIDYEKKLIGLYKNGELAEMLKTSWDLQIMPTISSFEFKVEESRNRQKGAVTIKVNSVDTTDKFPENIGTLPEQPTVNTVNRTPGEGNNDDDDDAESASDDVMYINGIISSGGMDNNNNGNNNNNNNKGWELNKEGDKEQMKKLNSVVELYKIEGVMNEKPNFETVEGGLKYIVDHPHPTPL